MNTPSFYIGDGLREQTIFMTFIKNLCISCLAELIKLSCPWYIWYLARNTLSCIFDFVLFLLVIMLIVFLPRFGDNALHHATILEEIPLPTPADIIPKIKQNFPTPEELKYHVKFWKDVFARYTSQQVIIHDDWYYQVVYEVVDLDRSPGVYAVMRKYKRILLAIDRKEKTHKLDSLSPQEARVYKMFEGISEKNKFRKAASQRMKARWGQRNQFLEAIQRSGLYQWKFEQIFQKHGLPVELTRIPFVESYFKYSAHSYAGAAGVWQFMPATARIYGLKMNYKVDERYDPYKSAESAACLLKANYEIFGSWPLAISAYHHGSGGVMKAVKQLKTTDLGKIVRKYRGAKFGFYSRNYYAQFLAVAEIMHNPQKYFGTVKRLPPLYYDQVIITQKIFVKDIASNLAISKDELTALNRDLKRAVIQSKSAIPRQFALKLPPGKKEQFLAQYAKQ